MCKPRHNKFGKMLMAFQRRRRRKLLKRELNLWLSGTWYYNLSHILQYTNAVGSIFWSRRGSSSKIATAF
jgi:hypothetical protein